MLKLLSKFKLLVIIPLIISLVFILLSVIPTNYDLTVPATLSDIDETYDFEGINTDDVNVSSVAVYSYYNINILNYLQALINPYAIIEEHNKYVNTSVEYETTSGTIQKKVALNNSLIAGYNAANVNIDATFKGYIVHTIFGTGKNPLELGDIITKCEGVELTEDVTITDVLIDKYGFVVENGIKYVDIQIGKEYHFTVKRGSQELELNVSPFGYEYDGQITPSLGFNVYEYFILNKNSSEVKYTINSPDSFGPSAGLMQALFVYDSLTKEKLTKDLHVTGTGTIDSKGNAGVIGGVKAKIMAAVLDNADIFFVPQENYSEAKEEYDKHQTDMLLVNVTSLDDVINFLKDFKE